MRRRGCAICRCIMRTYCRTTAKLATSPCDIVTVARARKICAARWCCTAISSKTCSSGEEEEMSEIYQKDPQTWEPDVGDDRDRKLVSERLEGVPLLSE